jgi:hypothetical protein
MTTQSWSSRWRHDSDATFQEWATDLYNKLIAIGLVQHTDTGQLATPVVASRPGVNTEAGFWIFRFNDTQQSSAPIFIRVGVGTMGGTTTPRIQVTKGTGTNGTGTLTGTCLSVLHNIHATGTSAHTADTPRQSYFCHTDGFLGIRWKSVDNLESWFYICRTVDASGSPTATGAIAGWGITSSTAMNATQAYRYASPAVAYTENTGTGTALGMAPQTQSSSAVGADLQAFMGYTITPQVSPLLGVCGVMDAELTSGTTFTATLVGVTPHTYIALTTAAPFSVVGAGSVGGLKYAMLWE